MIFEAQLALGTNLGNKEQNLIEVIKHLEKNVGKIIGQTKFKETAPWGYNSKNNYLNMIVKIETAKNPINLLKEIKNIERLMGRNQKIDENTYEDRVIDIDILYYGNLKFISEKLQIPHQKISERNFFNFFWYKIE